MLGGYIWCFKMIFHEIKMQSRGGYLVLGGVSGTRCACSPPETLRETMYNPLNMAAKQPGSQGTNRVIRWPQS